MPAHTLRHRATALEHKLPKSFEHLEAARDEILAFTVFPKEIWKQAKCGLDRTGKRS